MKVAAPILFLLFVFGCKKSDVTPPEIVVISPQQSQVFSSGQTVTIKATITDNVGLHMVHVIAVDNTGGHWAHSEDHVDGRNFQVNKTFVTNPGKTYTITIEATDHDDNTASKEIIVSSN
ncbi:MAG: DUF4625 domain-containing protein [Flavisolibacter sp.]|nr:DUF4625 domain-containing protein [Flavisolibacter sp.]